MPRGDGTGPRGGGPGTGRRGGQFTGGSRGGVGQGRGQGSGSGGMFNPGGFFRRNNEVTNAAPQGTIKKAVIDDNLCIGCAVCIRVCPFYAIEAGEKIRVDNDKCTGCGNCVSACPVGAIKLQ
ncbi:4Fe-4S binding protein [bacterium]|nr:4Fe-4S binding protein [bacterium]